MIFAGLAGAVVLSLSMTNTFSAFSAAITNPVNTAATGTVILQEVNTTAGAGNTTCNSTDTSGSGNSGNTINTNAYTCATINKYGGSTTMVPSNSNTTPTNTSVTTLTFKNTGTSAAATFTLNPGMCTQGTNGAVNGSATDFCSQLHVNITSGATAIFTGTAASLKVGGTFALPAAQSPLAAGSMTTITFTVYLDATAGNTYQGLSASQPLIWTLSS